MLKFSVDTSSPIISDDTFLTALIFTAVSINIPYDGFYGCSGNTTVIHPHDSVTVKSVKSTKPCYAKSIVVEPLGNIYNGGDLPPIPWPEAVYVWSNHRVQMHPALIQANQY